MKKKEIKERCKRLFSFFTVLNDVNNSPYGEGLSLPLPDFIYKIALEKEDTKDLPDISWDMWDVAFAVGFVIGNFFEITYPEAQEDIDAIKTLIRKKNLLPYLPKERRVNNDR